MIERQKKEAYDKEMKAVMGEIKKAHGHSLLLLVPVVVAVPLISNSSRNKTCSHLTRSTYGSQATLVSLNQTQRVGCRIFVLLDRLVRGEAAVRKRKLP